MSIKNIVVVDTVGGLNVLHQDFFDRFPFVDEWHGHEPDRVKDTIPHPHGGMCMGQALMPLWNDSSEIHAHFIRVFDSRGGAINEAFGGFAIDTIREIAKTGPTYVNNSWGSYIADAPMAPWKELATPWRGLIESGIPMWWASGNSGDFLPDVDEEVPQGLLVDISDKIAAGWKDGRTAEYSSDSKNAPPTATFWSTMIHLLNPVTAEWEVASGTSFAAPKATGLCAKLELNHEEFVALAKAEASYPPGYPDRLRPHPKWGYGWLEHLYQREIEGNPSGFTSQDPQISMMNGGLMWFDFQQVDALSWGKKL